MEFKSIVAQYLETLDGVEGVSELLEVPDDRSMGDVALPCFQLAKALRKAPQQIATDIAEQLSPTDQIERIEAVGPYVNFFARIGWLAGVSLPKILNQGNEYGRLPRKGETLLIEGWQPNTHKVVHVGHLRNALVSEAVSTVCEAGGYDVIKCSYLGDIGAHVAKWMWYYVNFDKSDVPSEMVGLWAGKIYVAAGKKIDEDPDRYKQEVHEMHKRLESDEEELVAIRKDTAQKCLDDIHAINNELGSTDIQREYLESHVEQSGIEIVTKLAEQGVAGIEYSDGAVIRNLEEFNLGVFVLLKSNGASLYSTKDIALAYLKEEEFTFDKSLYIVATEQIHHFNQLFKTLELIGYEHADKLVHVSYGMVELASGKMSSRDGNIVTYYDLRDTVLAHARAVVEDRELTVEQKDEIARNVGFGAMKFDMLLQDAYKKIIFDMESAVSFEGETGPYIQYTHARASSVLRKAGDLPDVSDVDFSRLDKTEERILINILAEFGSVIGKAAEEYKPNLVARYVLTLAHVFNKYYQKCKVVTDDEKLTHARLILVASVKQVLANGLRLLGIDAPERM